ncbi:DUF2218 domain-containing protein [Rhodohalobacter sp. 614A]|uniref:DUF2218 domain-containing protein n=1 Tax=Rhodohalobacter sp. 614A TaxID=2908649 RepID=UPI001F2D5F8A|nr:DUF2218 domain-containing protein [Rhodohalobacter sp. 614A]
MKEISRISTDNGSIYIKRLCKHFSHKVPASFSENEGNVEFPYGDCIMTSDDNQLTFVITADSEENLSNVKSVLISHLEKFSRDEELTVEWHKQD